MKRKATKSKLVSVMLTVVSMFLLVSCEDVISDILAQQNVKDLLSGFSGSAQGFNVQKVTQILGKSYDLTGTYADSTNQPLKPVLDANKLATENLISRDFNAEKSVIEYKAESSIESLQESYQRDITVSAGAGMEGLFSFSTAVTNNFGEKQAKSTNYSYATLKSDIRKAAYYIDGFKSFATPNYEDDDVKKVLDARSDEFLNAIAKVTDVETAKAFVNAWGTSVILGGFWGATAEYTISAYESGSSTSQTLLNKLKLDASVTIKVVSVSAGNETAVEEAYSREFQAGSENRRTTVKGGESQFAQNINDSSDYGKWVDSINESNITWVEYYPKSVVSIYDLIEDEATRNLVRDAVLNYFASKKLVVGPTPPPNPVLMRDDATNEVIHQGRHGGWLRNTEGDGNIFSNWTTWTYYKIDVKFSEGVGMNSGKLRMDIFLSIWEWAKDNTVIEGYSTVYITPQVRGQNVKLVRLLGGPRAFRNNYAYDSWGRGEWIAGGIADEWQNLGAKDFGNLWVMLDSVGPDVHGNGIKVQVGLPIEYYEL